MSYVTGPLRHNLHRPNLIGGPKLIAELRRAVQRSDLTQGEIEKAAGISSRYISCLGTPRSVNPRLDHLVAIGQVLGLELVWKPKS